METQLDPTQPRLALTSQGQVAYYDIGQGPVLLMLHGFPDTPQTFGDPHRSPTRRPVCAV